MKGRCRVRVYEPDDVELDATVVIASELAEEPEPGIWEAASTIAARVAASFRLYKDPCSSTTTRPMTSNWSGSGATERRRSGAWARTCCGTWK